MSWHIDPDAAKDYVEQRRSGSAVASIEAHLPTCADCRLLVADVTAATNEPLLDLVWQRVATALDDATRPWSERALTRVGLSTETARLARRHQPRPAVVRPRHTAHRRHRVRRRSRRPRRAVRRLPVRCCARSPCGGRAVRSAAASTRAHARYHCTDIDFADHVAAHRGIAHSSARHHRPRQRHPARARLGGDGLAAAGYRHGGRVARAVDLGADRAPPRSAWPPRAIAAPVVASRPAAELIDATAGPGQLVAVGAAALAAVVIMSRRSFLDFREI